MDFVTYGEKYAIFTNILILTVSRIAFTKMCNLRNFDTIFTNRHLCTSRTHLNFAIIPVFLPTFDT